MQVFAVCCAIFHEITLELVVFSHMTAVRFQPPLVVTVCLAWLMRWWTNTRFALLHAWRSWRRPKSATTLNVCNNIFHSYSQAAVRVASPHLSL